MHSREALSVNELTQSCPQRANCTHCFGKIVVHRAQFENIVWRNVDRNQSNTSPSNSL